MKIPVLKLLMLVPLALAGVDVWAQLRLYKDGAVVYSMPHGMVDSVVFTPPRYVTKPSQQRAPSGVSGRVAEAVDMGLSVKWAEWNVGASGQFEAGDFFAWGEVNPGKKTYDWQNYYWLVEGFSDWLHISKYQAQDKMHVGCWYSLVKGATTFEYTGDGRAQLTAADDAATQHWGDKWRMPTLKEFADLCNPDNCVWQWMKAGTYKNNPIAGYLITSRRTNNAIFLPVTGVFDGAVRQYQTQNGHYWSSSLNKNYTREAYGLVFYSGTRYGGYEDARSNGLCIRPVCP